MDKSAKGSLFVAQVGDVDGDAEPVINDGAEAVGDTHGKSDPTTCSSELFSNKTCAEGAKTLEKSAKGSLFVAQVCDVVGDAEPVINDGEEAVGDTHGKSDPTACSSELFSNKTCAEGGKTVDKSAKGSSFAAHNKITDVELQPALVTYASICNKDIKVTIIVNNSDSVPITKKKYTRRRNIKRTRFGRTIQKKGKRKTAKATPSLIATIIDTDLKDEATISSLSTESDRMHNLKRCLSTSKKQVKYLKDDNKKYKTRIDLLTKKINQMNNELRKEKKAANILLAQSRRENQDVLTDAETTIKLSESVKFKKILEDKKVEQIAKTTKVIRNYRMESYRKMANIKANLSEEKNLNLKLLETIRVMENEQRELNNKLFKTNKNLLKEYRKHQILKKK